MPSLRDSEVTSRTSTCAQTGISRNIKNHQNHQNHKTNLSSKLHKSSVRSVAGITGDPQTLPLCVLSGQSSLITKHFDVAADWWFR